ncbi:hypothetical protein HOT75_gp162 [Gordonia phage Daredevil]|uniref:Uncharacterized protein n=1 Tax=Gordonia phage Daredevil TaxID=2283286 RepID=A0A345MJ17_9CAUD|nr:hypothetical protein HOT75_gp162 [Gordonia phage Daredevil]AXH70548.1 hypothetical protein SEA_DAREDEVIL_162 [Gordonia phage Daredevil]
MSIAQEIKTVVGDEAFNALMNVDTDRCLILEYRTAWDCDTARTVDSDVESDLSMVLFMVLLYRDQPERVSIAYTPDQWGDLDRKYDATLIFDTGSDGEPALTSFTFVPQS